MNILKKVFERDDVGIDLGAANNMTDNEEVV